MIKRLLPVLLVFLIIGCAPKQTSTSKREPGGFAFTTLATISNYQKEISEQKWLLKRAEQKEKQLQRAMLAFEERLGKLEENQTRISEEGKRLEEAFEVLQKTQNEINKKQAKLESGQARVQEEQAVKEILGRKQEKPKARKRKMMGKNPYAVHVASYKILEPAKREMKQLQKEGFLAYLSLYSDPRKGEWYRVLVDRFKSKREADAFASQLRKIKDVKYSQTLYLPYSVEINTYNTYEEASKAENLLFDKDYLAYIIPIQSPTKGISYQLLVGAYRSKKVAKIVSKNLERDGYKSRIILP